MECELILLVEYLSVYLYRACVKYPTLSGESPAPLTEVKAGLIQDLSRLLLIEQSSIQALDLLCSSPCLFLNPGTCLVRVRMFVNRVCACLYVCEPEIQIYFSILRPNLKKFQKFKVLLSKI